MMGFVDSGRACHLTGARDGSFLQLFLDRSQKMAFQIPSCGQACNIARRLTTYCCTRRSSLAYIFSPLTYPGNPTTTTTDALHLLHQISNQSVSYCTTFNTQDGLAKRPSRFPPPPCSSKC